MLQRHLKTHRAACPTDAAVDLASPPPPPSPAPESRGERPMCDLCAKTFASQKTRSSSIGRLFLSSVRPTLLLKGAPQEPSHQ